MKTGAEPKKLAILAGLALVAGYMIYTNVFSGPPAGASTPVAKTQAPARLAAVADVGGPVPRVEVRASTDSALQEFRPSLKPKKGSEQADLSSIDPTLRLDLLAKLEEVTVQSGGRSLFEFAPSPLPAKPEAKVIPKPLVQPVPFPPPTPAAQEKPPAPPIPLKFYGYITPSRQGARRAFFLDGDQILVGSEGDVLKQRYRVVKIGVNSVVIEDLEFKTEQTLPLEPQAATG